MIPVLVPLLCGLGLLSLSRLIGISGGAFIGAIIGGALARLLYPAAKPPPKRLQGVARILLGISIGVQVNRQTLNEIESAAVPILCMVTGIIVFSFLLAGLVSKLSGMDVTTSLCGSSPGMMTVMIMLAEDLGGNVPVVAVLHTLKVFLTVGFMPLITRLVQTGEDVFAGTAGQAIPQSLTLYYGKLGFLILAGFLLEKLLRRVKVPSSEFMAGLFIASICNPLFLQLEIFPPLCQLAALWIIATSIGCQITRRSLAAVRRYIFPCIALVVTQVMFGLLLGWILFHTTSMDIVTAFTGTSPIAMEAMVILSAEMRANVPLVTAMHTTRVIIVMIVMPLLIRWVSAKKSRRG
ncbi:MAG: AbrB family transcriptional regulator [Spirochaetales bacterium]|jgi:membrane AbrB-like protein|nr:AbrB family transcriptional regulator [Spirochaetales bacterium]